MNVLFRTDGSSEIGFGHVMRCLALAESIKTIGGDCVFVLAKGGQDMAEHFKKKNIDWMPLNAESGSKNDAEITLLEGRRRNIAWFVVDGYSFDKSYQELLASTGLRLMVLDDGGQIGGYHADIILDQNESSPRRLYAAACNRGTHLLSGSRYTLVRSEFQNREQPASPVIRHVLVTTGGGSDNGLAIKIVQALSESLANNICLIVVAGLHNLQLPELKKLQCDRIKVLEKVEDMSTLMKKAELAITSAGSICWEYCTMGVPMLLFVTDHNQEFVAQSLVESGAAVNLGAWDDVHSPRKLHAKVENLARNTEARQTMAKSGLRLIDGNGAQRVAEYMETVVHAD